MRVGLAAPVLGLALAIGLAGAHQPPRTTTRVLVRAQGHRDDPKPAPGTTLLLLTALGTEHRFAASELRAFGVGDEPAAQLAAGRYTLQGPRGLLARFAAARPEQTVSILAEHRPGSHDWFVLGLDLCPPR